MCFTPLVSYRQLLQCTAEADEHRRRSYELLRQRKQTALRLDEDELCPIRPIMQLDNASGGPSLHGARRLHTSTVIVCLTHISDHQTADCHLTRAS